MRVLQAEGIDDQRLLVVFQRIRRAAFVPPAWRTNAYENVPIPIAHEQVTTQPSLSALMVQALQLQGSERVLEIGTGLGFQTAILASLSREVYSIEWFAALAEQARRNLEVAEVDHAMVIVGDGSLGLPEHAPYDAILVSAAAPSTAPPLAEQLAEGGRLVQPVGPDGSEVVTVFRKQAGRLQQESIVTGRFVPLRGSYGALSHATYRVL